MKRGGEQLAGMQLGIHWPYCDDSQCPGCMPELRPLPLPPCAPALGLHVDDCVCGEAA